MFARGIHPPDNLAEVEVEIELYKFPLVQVAFSVDSDDGRNIDLEPTAKHQCQS